MAQLPRSPFAPPSPSSGTGPGTGPATGPSPSTSSGLELAVRPKNVEVELERQERLAGSLARRCLACERVITDDEDHYLVNDRVWCTECTRRDVGSAVGEPRWWAVQGAKVAAGAAVVGVLWHFAGMSFLLAMVLAAILTEGPYRGGRAWRRRHRSGGAFGLNRLVDGILGQSEAVPIVQLVKGRPKV